MKTEFLKGLGLEKEAIDKIMAENGKDIELEKGKAKDLQTQLDTANNTIKERDKQLEDLKNSPDNPETLKQQIQQLQNDNKKAKETHDAEIKEIKTMNAAKAELLKAKAKDADLVLKWIDLSKVELQENGTLKGLTEQVEALKTGEASKAMFETEKKQSNNQFSGFVPGGNPNSSRGTNPTTQSTLTDAIRNALFKGNE